jgi:4-hydroxybenzoate polyprenyltransferase
MIAGRLARYLLVMFPPVLGALGAAAFFSIWLGLQALAGSTPLRVGLHGAVGTLTAPLWMLLVRLLDDLHDAPADLRLAQAGDPRYRDRPTVTGAITLGEIRALALGTAGAILVLNLLPGSPAMALAGPVALLLTWLAFRWFFIPGLARNPGPLAYLARKSLAVLVGIYALVAFRDRWPGGAIGALAVPLILAPIFEVAAWEIARKIRLPADETTYPTYSRLLGWRRAALAPGLFAGAAAGCLLAVGAGAAVGAGYQVVVVGAALVVVAAGLRLRLGPTPARARLEPVARLFAALAHGGLVVALVLRHGLAAR